MMAEAQIWKFHTASGHALRLCGQQLSRHTAHPTINHALPSKLLYGRVSLNAFTLHTHITEHFPHYTDCIRIPEAAEIQGGAQYQTSVSYENVCGYVEWEIDNLKVLIT